MIGVATMFFFSQGVMNLTAASSGIHRGLRIKETLLSLAFPVLTCPISRLPTGTRFYLCS